MISEPRLTEIIAEISTDPHVWDVLIFRDCGPEKETKLVILRWIENHE